MGKARIEHVKGEKWKITESVESFLRFALRDSNFSNAVHRIIAENLRTRQWNQTSVAEALGIAKYGIGIICIEYVDLSKMINCSMCIDTSRGLLMFGGNEELVRSILSECGV